MNINIPVKIETIPMKVFDLKYDSEKFGTSSFIVPPRNINGVVAINIDLINLLNVRKEVSLFVFFLKR
tara:strand:+ start:338 stop:541 length:204 start_codon:yes stop_codon:yes gene_type:complete